MADPTTEGLHVEQIQRAREEHARAEAADAPSEAQQHRRRAAKAAYLREKLAERAEAEERVDGET